jgi:hypothetical protein
VVHAVGVEGGQNPVGVERVVVSRHVHRRRPVAG